MNLASVSFRPVPRSRVRADPTQGVLIHLVHVVCTSAFAGVERYIGALAPRQAEQGLSVTVVGGNQAAMRAALGEAPVGEPVRLVPAASMPEAVRALNSIPRPDLINSHMSDADLAAIVIRGLRRGPRIVSTRHFGARRGSSVPARAVFGVAGRRIGAQIAISDFVAQQIEGGCVVIRTGVADAPPADAAHRDRTVLMAQRLEREKATDVGLRAWAATRARADGWRLQIAGEGAQRPDLERLVDELGIIDSVDFLGYRTDIDDLMSRAGMLLAPTPREGLGLSALEGMARALPVVASASGGHLETVGGVKDAALFPSSDWHVAADHIDRLAFAASSRDEYGARLRSRQREEFGIQRQVDRTTEVYEEVLGS